MCDVCISIEWDCMRAMLASTNWRLRKHKESRSDRPRAVAIINIDDISIAIVVNEQPI